MSVTGHLMIPLQKEPMKKLLLVDFENMSDATLAGLEPDTEVIVYVGVAQKSVPLELALVAQKLGNQLHFFRVPGAGSNALDFFIAHTLGQRLERKPDLCCTILSKDKGFDPLIKYLTQLGFQCCRKETLISPPPAAPKALPAPSIAPAAPPPPQAARKACGGNQHACIDNKRRICPATCLREGTKVLQKPEKPSCQTGNTTQSHQCTVEKKYLCKRS